MSISLESISKGRARKAPRIILAGVEKIGKSTFAAGAPNPIFLQMNLEQGCDELDCAKFPKCDTLAGVTDCLEVLAEKDHDYKTVVIDSASTLEPIVWAETCRVNGNAASIEQVNGGYGKGYIEALRHWSDVLSGLDYLRDERGMGVIIIAHVKVKAFNDPLAEPYDTYLLNLQDRAAALLSQWADAILFANFKTYTRAIDPKAPKKIVHATGTGDRFMYTEKRPGHPGGTRYRGIPYELPLNYQAFADAINAAPAINTKSLVS